MSTDARRFTSLWMMQAVPRPAAVAVEAVVEAARAVAAVAVAVLVAFLPFPEREPELQAQRPDVGLYPLHPRLLEAVEAQVRAVVLAEAAVVAVAAALKPFLVAAVAPRFPVSRSLTCCWLPVLM
jgi:hypothetical protein